MCSLLLLPPVFSLTLRPHLTFILGVQNSVTFLVQYLQRIDLPFLQGLGCSHHHDITGGGVTLTAPFSECNQSSYINYHCQLSGCLVPLWTVQNPTACNSLLLLCISFFRHLAICFLHFAISFITVHLLSIFKKLCCYFSSAISTTHDLFNFNGLYSLHLLITILVNIWEGKCMLLIYYISLEIH